MIKSQTRSIFTFCAIIIFMAGCQNEQKNDSLEPVSQKIESPKITKDIKMAKPKTGDTVKVHYTGKLDDGKVFDSSVGKTPLQFKVGEQKVIPGFEKAVLELEPGEKKTIIIKSDQAYGSHHKEMVITAERKNIPENIKPEIGQMLEMREQDKDGKPGRTFAVLITAITDTDVTLDANHPLAGKDLTFEIELVEIVA